MVLTPLHRHRGFVLLWAGQAVSETGSQISLLALPLLATLTLHASTLQVALLSVCSSAAFLLVTLHVGVLVDRRRRRPVLVRADWARAVVLGTVPVAQLLGVLTLWQLYAVALTAGVLTVFFDVAYQAYVPSLVPRAQLVEANSRLGATAEVARSAGPALAGVLVSVVGAPYAVALDAASFLVSGAATRAVPDVEAPPAPRAADARVRTEIAEGLSFVLRHPVLSRVVGCTGTSNFFSSLYAAVEVVFLVRVLHASPATIGLVFSLAALGGIAGATLAAPLARAVGSARLLWLSLAVTAPLAFAGASAFPGRGVALVGVAACAQGAGAVVYNIGQLSYRQAVCPPALLGRMNAAVRFVVWGTMPLGGLCGGLIGSAFGVRPTLFVGAAGECAAVAWLLSAPLLRRRDLPTDEIEALEAARTLSAP